MKTVKMLIVTLLTLNSMACATMKSQVFDGIHDGDDGKRVKKVLGEPEIFTQTEAEAVWTYIEQDDSCSITLKTDKVVAKSCDKKHSFKMLNGLIAKDFSGE